LTPVKDALAQSDAAFFEILCRQTRAASVFEDALTLSTLRRKGAKKGLVPQQKSIRLAIVGGCSLYPLHELAQHYLSAEGETSGLAAELFVGDYDNYVSEILDASSRLYAFAPEAILLIPSVKRCRYEGNILDSREQQHAQAKSVAD